MNVVRRRPHGAHDTNDTNNCATSNESTCRRQATAGPPSAFTLGTAADLLPSCLPDCAPDSGRGGQQHNKQPRLVAHCRIGSQNTQTLSDSDGRHLERQPHRLPLEPHEADQPVVDWDAQHTHLEHEHELWHGLGHQASILQIWVGIDRDKGASANDGDEDDGGDDVDDQLGVDGREVGETLAHRLPPLVGREHEVAPGGVHDPEEDVDQGAGV
mmetsp:Transcript_52111/g.136997  ORF Transcript_52111/g.136997 Transcript_52111/m.136997 type:complete len:214 (-) Transcript_52111:258-899(-)